MDLVGAEILTSVASTPHLAESREGARAPAVGPAAGRYSQEVRDAQFSSVHSLIHSGLGPPTAPGEAAGGREPRRKAATQGGLHEGNKAKKTQNCVFAFGGPATVGTLPLGPCLCVPGFRRVCLFGLDTMLAENVTEDKGGTLAVELAGLEPRG